MIIVIPQVLTAEQVSQMRQHMDQADWQDGRSSAGDLAVNSKQNQQLSLDDPLNQQLADFVLGALARQPEFVAAALPLKILPPMFNRYRSGETYGLHVDNAIRLIPGSATRLRTDLSATLFLAEQSEYQGGELEIEDQYGTQRIKLNAGDMVLYPSTSLHRVLPVTQGQRVAAFFWIQSMVRQHEQREVLYQLDKTIRELTTDLGANASPVLKLTQVYHKLMRQLADT
ncbi:Fe2+-dependent dioxygenase [Neptuniibacter sp. CAU 1671]|uniref:Fe2+-dependent dioxygenase n=1 Tax=Neptuniibacter sp. CAU 1671 TaxID=3032593 RepID=UPI0023DC11A1|nr:Fe2+-dependent dioxygenase [Neptuniibacter sp. CAU 1671]MDF2182817.1 Fe2+-dependent dioxygenase [Neptuniibacter sp. CAU 1671]